MVRGDERMDEGGALLEPVSDEEPLRPEAAGIVTVPSGSCPTSQFGVAGALVGAGCSLSSECSDELSSAPGAFLVGAGGSSSLDELSSLLGMSTFETGAFLVGAVFPAGFLACPGVLVDADPVFGAGFLPAGALPVDGARGAVLTDFDELAADAVVVRRRGCDCSSSETPQSVASASDSR